MTSVNLMRTRECNAVSVLLLSYYITDPGPHSYRLAGQMAMMRGDKVKTARSGDDDDESGTDDDEEGEDEESESDWE